MTTAPMVMPEVVTGLSLVLLFTHPALSFLGGRGALAIWAAHTTLCAAYAAVLVQSRLRELDRSLEEAALDLGCPPFKVFFIITVPVIAPALVSAWLLTFTLSMDDFVLAAMLSDPGSTTLPVLIFARLHHGLKPEINALATIIVVIVSIAVLTANHIMLSSHRQRLRRNRLPRQPEGLKIGARTPDREGAAPPTGGALAAGHQAGWLNTVSGGSLPVKRSTSAVPVCPQLPCASLEVPSPLIRLLTSP